MAKTRLVIIIMILTLYTSQAAFSAGYQPFVAGNPIPHGGYVISSNKCKICHAMHGTPVGSFHLLPRRVTDRDWGGCEQCHSEASSFAAPTVYSMPEYRGQHSLGASLIPDSSKKLPNIEYSPGGVLQASLAVKEAEGRDAADYFGVRGFLRCITCHSPHANNTIMGGSKILRWDPARDGNKAQTLTEFCADCHNHNYVTWYGGRSHPLVSPTERDIAFSPAVACVNCHRAPKSIDGGQFPHQSVGVSLLKAEYTGNNIDTVCIDCHKNSDNTKGVGITF